MTKQNIIISCLQEIGFKYKYTERLEEKNDKINCTKRVGVAIVISNEIDFKTKNHC